MPFEKRIVSQQGITVIQKKDPSVTPLRPGKVAIVLAGTVWAIAVLWTNHVSWRQLPVPLIAVLAWCPATETATIEIDAIAMHD